MEHEDEQAEMAAAEYAAEACPKPFDLSIGFEPRTEQEIDTEKALKPRVDLIPGHALLEVGRTMAYGFNKHGECTWRNAGTEQAKASTHVASASRHLAEYLGDPDATEEGSGLSVLAHCAAQLLIAIECRRRELADVPVYDANAVQVGPLTQPRSVAYVGANIDDIAVGAERDGAVAWQAFVSRQELRGYEFHEVVLVNPEDLDGALKANAYAAARLGTSPIVRAIWTPLELDGFTPVRADAKRPLTYKGWDVKQWPEGDWTASKSDEAGRELRLDALTLTVLQGRIDKLSDLEAERTPYEIQDSDDMRSIPENRPLTYKGWDVIPTSSGCAVRGKGGQLLAFSCLPEAVKFIRKA